jgi:hypothetical protein
MALFGPDGSNRRCPFIGVKRPSELRPIKSEVDPEQTFGNSARKRFL